MPLSSRSASRLAPSRLLQPLVSAAIFDFWAGQLAPGVAWNRPLARVVERRVEARDTVTLVLRPNRHFRGFLPGQHVNLGVEVDGRRLSRSYSLTSIPRRDRLLSITVKRIEGGKVSGQLCSRTRVGDVLEIGQAFGEMTLAEPTGTRRLLLAAGSGITPLISLVRQRAAAGAAADLTLIYWARSRAELCFVRELNDIAAAQPGFRVHFVLTRENDLLPGEFRGRPDAALLESLVPDLADRRVYACGPGGFVGTLRGLLDGRVPSFAAEAFTPSPIASTATGSVRVQLLASGRTLEIPAGQALLPALEAQGLQPAYGCRMGICNTCACAKLEGSTQNLDTGEIQTESDSALRLCVSRACTDLTLDL